MSPHPFETDLTTWEIGPFHGSLTGPMRLKLRLDGEIIAHCQVETGFLHRGLEKACELHAWRSSVAYLDHLDPENAVFGELVLCLAVEEISELKVPPRANSIRMILAELTRISAHLAFMVRVAKSVGAETIVHYMLRDREKILDLFELLTGARFSLNFLRFGGVSADVTDGFIERVGEVCELLQIRTKEYNDLFTFNHGFLKRTAFVGALSTELIHSFGITGPNARASGLGQDIRKDSPYSDYQLVDFKIPVGMGEGGCLGDTHDRFVLRLREMTQSIAILKQLVDDISPGPFISGDSEKNHQVPPGEAYARIESSRGLLGCHVVSDGSDRPSRIQIRPPSLGHIMALPELLKGTRVEDLPVVVASMDLGIAEVDR